MAYEELSDLKVVEFANLVSGPYCGKILADMGAEVIKVEAPGLGDEARRRAPFAQDRPGVERSGLFAYLNMNKLSVTLNVRTVLGKSLFKEQFEDNLLNQKTPEVIKFREHSIVRFLDDFTQMAKSNGLQNSVCILPPSLDLDDGIHNIEKIFQLEAVDIMATDPYWSDDNSMDVVEQQYSSNSKLLLQLGNKYYKQALKLVQ